MINSFKYFKYIKLSNCNPFYLSISESFEFYIKKGIRWPIYLIIFLNQYDLTGLNKKLWLKELKNYFNNHIDIIVDLYMLSPAIRNRRC